MAAPVAEPDLPVAARDGTCDSCRFPFYPSALVETPLGYSLCKTCDGHRENGMPAKELQKKSPAEIRRLLCVLQCMATKSGNGDWIRGRLALGERKLRGMADVVKSGIP
jgi:hypothetical protein